MVHIEEFYHASGGVYGGREEVRSDLFD